MKAKDLATEYVSRLKNGEEDKDVLFGLFKQVFFEIEEIAKMRHAKRHDALAAIVREQHEKWQAFIRRLPAGLAEGMNPNGFLMLMRKLMPEFWAGLPLEVTGLVEEEA